MLSLQSKLVWLAAIHVVAGLGAAWLVVRGSVPEASATFLDALLGAELGMLGVWAGFGEHSKAAGFVGVAAGTTYVSILEMAEAWPAVAATGADAYVVLWYLMFYLALALLALSGIVATAVVLRRRGVRLRREPIGTEGLAGEDVQFSMRQLMLLVFVVAVLVRLGPTVQAKFNSYFSAVSMLLAIACWGACFATVALAGLWAALGGRLSAARICMAGGLAGGLSLLPPYYFPELLTDDFARSAVVLVGALGIEIGSLLVIRGCGYRLAANAARGAAEIAPSAAPD
ncbi:MAG TPA: hypothetical protein VN699_00875 [Pirellulales bacterium]|nr:hypothetical protein [Pirellulales bacterium]